MTAHALALAPEMVDPVLNVLHFESYEHGISVFRLVRRSRVYDMQKKMFGNSNS
jgi:hypothetical protein